MRLFDLMMVILARVVYIRTAFLVCYRMFPRH
jgi:hypothetical protein